jgi:2-polyprenyl-3-methyl-5-hydroxy-6-metoxy-1,4-benzoquinol methylase
MAQRMTQVVADGADPETDHIKQRDELVGRLNAAAVGMLDLLTVYVGGQLGLYRALIDHGPMTSLELATRAGADERYVREWLEQQAATGLLLVEGVEGEPESRRYLLPPPYAEVLAERDSISYLGGLARLLVGVTRPLPAVLDAFRTGGGVPYAAYGADTWEGIAEMNRPMFLHLLGSSWLPSMPDVHARLQARPAASVVDIGCGQGWSSIALARAYPEVRVRGIDLDPGSIEQARHNASAAGVADRVTFSVGDAADPGLAGRFDLVTAFETLHDMARPTQALRAMRDLVADGGAVVVAEERVADELRPPTDDVERLNYGFSVLHCLPASLAEQPSEAIGTVLRPPRLLQLALAAGFSDVEVLPIDSDVWRFYRLQP